MSPTNTFSASKPDALGGHPIMYIIIFKNTEFIRTDICGPYEV